MIIEMNPLTISEVKNTVKLSEDQKDLKDYLKKFGKLTSQDAKKLGDEIRDLNNLKVKEAQIIKIVDFLPKNPEDLKKIFNDLSLDEKETNEILEIVKKY